MYIEMKGFFILKSSKNNKEDYKMCKKVSFKVSNGMDSTVRVLTTLRRKNFSVKEFSMEEMGHNSARLVLTVDDDHPVANFNRAVLQMKKLVDVYDVEEL